MTRKDPKLDVGDPTKLELVPEGLPFVSIYCAEDSHSERPWLLTTFYPLTDDAGQLVRHPDGTPFWTEALGQYWTNSRQIVATGTKPTRTYLVHGQPTTDRLKVEMAGKGEVRSILDLQCRRCGLSVRRKAIRLDKVLTILGQHLPGEISLRAIAQAVPKDTH